jgi:hypothetical protein
MPDSIWQKEPCSGGKIKPSVVILFSSFKLVLLMVTTIHAHIFSSCHVFIMKSPHITYKVYILIYIFLPVDGFL